MKKKNDKWLWILVPILAILTVLIEYGEIIACIIFLIVFMFNKTARKDFKKFWKDHKKPLILFLLVAFLPFLVVLLIPYLVK